MSGPDEAGIPIQVHSTISRHNANDLDNLCNLFEKLAIVMWNVFFLVPVGRGQLDDLLSGEEFEQVFGKIYELSRACKLPDQDHGGDALPPLPACSTTWKSGASGTGIPASRSRHTATTKVRTNPARRRPTPRPATVSWATRRVNDGKGFVFISHVGNVYPSGFLPIHAGNIRETPLAEIYRNAPIFKALRDTSSLEGKCGACEYKEICGGSRARAYALTGDPLAQEPCCIYQPKNWDPERERTRKRSNPLPEEIMVQL